MPPRQLTDSTTHERRRSLLSTADRLVFSYGHKPTSAGDRAHRQDSPSCKRPRPILGPPARSPSSCPDRQPRTLRDRCGGPTGTSDSLRTTTRSADHSRSADHRIRSPTLAARRSGPAHEPTTTSGPPRTPATRSRSKPPADHPLTSTQQAVPSSSTPPPVPVQRGILNQPPHFEDPSTLTRRSKTPASTRGCRV
jgi:hypothetical protein